MPPLSPLLTHLRSFLIAEGLVRDPDVAGAVPPFWRDPRSGAIAPGEAPGVQNDDDLVLSAFTVPGIPVGRFEQQQHRIDAVDIHFYGRNAAIALEAEPPIRAAIADRRDWDMAGLRVIESLEFRPIQPLGSDEQGFRYVAGYLIERYVNQPE